MFWGGCPQSELGAARLSQFFSFGTETLYLARSLQLSDNSCTRPKSGATIFETTLQSIGDAVIVCDSLGKVILMNPAAMEATGWTNEQANGQTLETVFRIINEGTRETVRESCCEGSAGRWRRRAGKSHSPRSTRWYRNTH